MIRTYRKAHLESAKNNVQRTARYLLDVQQAFPDDWRERVTVSLESCDRVVRDDAVLGGVVTRVGVKLIYLQRLRGEVVAVVRDTP